MTGLALDGADIAWAIPGTDTGLSADADQLRRQVDGVQRERTAGVRVAAPHRAALEALLDALREVTQPDWDGYGARPVSPAAAARAERFIVLLPTTLPPPDVSADPNGRLHFEWQPEPGRRFVVSIGPGDIVHYAGLFGRNTVHGSEELSDAIPQALLASLSRALDKTAA